MLLHDKFASSIKWNEASDILSDLCHTHRSPASGDVTAFRLSVIALGRVLRKTPFVSMAELHDRFGIFIKHAFIPKRQCMIDEFKNFTKDSHKLDPPSVVAEYPCKCVPTPGVGCSDPEKCECPGHRFLHSWGRFNMKGRRKQNFIKVPTFSLYISRILSRINAGKDDIVVVERLKDQLRVLQRWQKNIVHSLRVFVEEVWALPTPELIISVTGGANKFDLPFQVENEFMKGRHVCNLSFEIGCWECEMLSFFSQVFVLTLFLSFKD